MDCAGEAPVLCFATTSAFGQAAVLSGKWPIANQVLSAAAAIAQVLLQDAGALQGPRTCSSFSTAGWSSIFLHSVLPACSSWTTVTSSLAALCRCRSACQSCESVCTPSPIAGRRLSTRHHESAQRWERCAGAGVHCAAPSLHECLPRAVLHERREHTQAAAHHAQYVCHVLALFGRPAEW